MVQDTTTREKSPTIQSIVDVMFLECGCDRAETEARLRELIDNDPAIRRAFIAHAFKRLVGDLLNHAAGMARQQTYNAAVTRGERPTTGADIQTAPAVRAEARQEVVKTLFDTFPLYGTGGVYGDATIEKLEQELSPDGYLARNIRGAAKYGAFLTATRRAMLDAGADPEQTVRQVLSLETAQELLDAAAEQSTTADMSALFVLNLPEPAPAVKTTPKRKQAE